MINAIKRYFFSLEGNIRHIRERIEYWISYKDVWNLGDYLNSVTLRGLEEFRKVNCWYPGNLTQEKWDWILDEIIEWYKLIVNQDFWVDYTKEDKDKIKRAKKLLNKYERFLWD
jgi:hypothetical protein